MSNESPLRLIEEVRPPSTLRRSKSTTSAPPSAATERGRHPGQSTADDADAGRAHGVHPARLRAATRAFSQAGKETRPLVDSHRVALDAYEQSPVDAGHGGDAGPAAAVEKPEKLQALGEPLVGPAALEGDEPCDLGRGP